MILYWALIKKKPKEEKVRGRGGETMWWEKDRSTNPLIGGNYFGNQRKGDFNGRNESGKKKNRQI